MNINFSPIRFFGSINQSKSLANVANATNPIKYNKTLDKDTVSFTARQLKYERRMPSSLRTKIKEKDRLIEKINSLKARQDDLSDTEKHELTVAEQRLEVVKKYIDETIEFQDSRPNAAFLYDASLTPKQVREEFAKHPEFVELDDLAKELKCNDISKLFKLDALFDEAIVDMSYEPNRINYENLKEAIKGKISTKNSILPKISASLIKNGVLELVQAEIFGQMRSINFLECTDEQIKNIEKLEPKRSKYAPYRSSDKPQYAPLWYLKTLGYGTERELKTAYAEKRLKGKHRIEEQNGKTIVFVDLDLNDSTTKHNLTVLRNRNKNFYSVEDLAKKLGVSKADLQKAVIDGKLDTINSYIYGTDDRIGIDLSNPKNQEFLKDKLEEAQKAEQQKKEAAQPTMADIRKAQLENRGISITGLRTKIAWYFAPATREDASEIAKEDGYAAKVIAKEKEIRDRRRFGLEEDSEDKPKELTKQEKIKLASYYKTLWQQAGSDEFSQAMKKANEILDLYFEHGIMAIEDPELRRIIRKYTA